MEWKKSNRDILPKLRKLDQYMEGHNGYIAGGTFKNLFNSEKIRDIDIFFENNEDFKKALELFNSDEKYQKHYENDNCNAFKNKQTGITVELVKSRFDKAENMIGIFDFTIVQCAYAREISEDDGINYVLLYSPRFFEDLHQKKLVIDIDWNDMPHPINTYERTYKYTKYGYNLCRESKIKIIEMLRNVQGDIDVSQSLYFGID